VQSDSSQHLTTKEYVCQLHAKELPKVCLSEGETAADCRYQLTGTSCHAQIVRSPWVAPIGITWVAPIGIMGGTNRNSQRELCGWHQGEFIPFSGSNCYTQVGNINCVKEQSGSALLFYFTMTAEFARVRSAIREKLLVFPVFK
jgi:hypothetical protein